jgi:hypothetical protein
MMIMFVFAQTEIVTTTFSYCFSGIVVDSVGFVLDYFLNTAFACNVCDL